MRVTGQEVAAIITAAASLLAVLGGGVAWLVTKIAGINRLLRHELRPNSGTSVRDAVDRTEAMTAYQSDALTDVMRALDVIREDVSALRRSAIEDHRQIHQRINNLDERTLPPTPRRQDHE